MVVLVAWAASCEPLATKLATVLMFLLVLSPASSQGSCNWDPSDSGYHEVCVTMSDEFLTASATHDANDLRSVVKAGGHWCICAWAWAAAVQRDPANYEGITLDCERTNAKLREVYESFISAGADLTSPSGAAYKAKTALDAVNKVCPATAAKPVIAHGSTGARAPSLSPPSPALLAGTTTNLPVPDPVISTVVGSAGEYDRVTPSANIDSTTQQPSAQADPAQMPALTTSLSLIVAGALCIVAVLAFVRYGRRYWHRGASSEVARLTASGRTVSSHDESTVEVEKLGCYDSALSDEDSGVIGGVPLTPATSKAL